MNYILYPGKHPEQYTSDFKTIIRDINNRLSVLENSHIEYAELESLVSEINTRLSAVESTSNEQIINYVDEQINSLLESLNTRLTLIENRISQLEQSSGYDDTDILSRLASLETRITDEEQRECDYDDTEIREKIESLETEHAGILNITKYLSTNENNPTSAAEINTILKNNANGKNCVVVIGAGDYYIDGTLEAWWCASLYCFGNLIGPVGTIDVSPEMGTSTRKIINMRTLVLLNGINKNIYIKKITVRGNYCGAYVYYGYNMNIKIIEIVGNYKVSSYIRDTYYAQSGNNDTLAMNYGYEYGVRPLFNVTAATKVGTIDYEKNKNKRYIPIPDEWHLNAGFMSDKLQNSTINIGNISNLNKGIYFIETLPSDAPNFNDMGIMVNTFNINVISCKKAIVFDHVNAIETDLQTNITRIVSKNANDLKDNDIHGNIFNINGFDANTTSVNTNSIETFNSRYYDQTKNNNRVLIEMTGVTLPSGLLLANNTFNIAYAQGVYDMLLYAKNTGGFSINCYIQPNDVYFNDATARAQRNWNGISPTQPSKYISGEYQRNPNYVSGGTGNDGKMWMLVWDDSLKEITSPPMVYVENSINIKINNMHRSCFRETEIDVDSTSKNIYVNQVTTENTTNIYHIIDENNYNLIEQRIYNEGNVLFKEWAQGYTPKS